MQTGTSCRIVGRKCPNHLSVYLPPRLLLNVPTLRNRDQGMNEPMSPLMFGIMLLSPSP